MWNIDEGDQIVFIYNSKIAIVKPWRKIKVEECAGALGPPMEDEVEYSIINPELLPEYYRRKYRQGA